MFVTTKKLLTIAQKHGFAVGAFNVNNLEIIQGIVEAAKELDSPVILQISKGARDYAGIDYLKGLIEVAEKQTHLPIAMHLDHGPTVELCKKSVDEGFTSVMYDGSHEVYEENIKNTKKVTAYAHKKGVSVEAELGQLIGEQFDSGEGGKVAADAVFTDPDQAKDFVDKTDCDSLAIAIGTSHGAYKFKGEPFLDFERLKKIKKLVKIPLVLHAASSVLTEYVEMCNNYGGNLKGSKGVPEGHIKKAISLGIAKVNIDTDLRLAMTGAMRKEFVEHPEVFDPRKYLGAGREAIKEAVIRKIKLLGSDKKASLYR